MKIVKRISLLAIMLCLMSTVVHAASEDYVYIAAGEYYDTQSKSFVYVLSQLQDQEIYSNVPNGAVVTDTVSVVVDDSMAAELYCNGQLVQNADLSNITAAGGYTLSINSGGTSVQPLSFQIVPQVTGLLDEYMMPKGFSVTGVLLNGERQNFSSRGVSFDKEGEYIVDYTCSLTGRSYRLSVTIDHTPPTLALANVNEYGIAKGPVNVSDAESGAVMYILHDGKETSPVNGMLNQSGDYHIILTDVAGNTTEYVFRIGIYFNAAAIISFVILAALIVVFCVYLSKERRKLRVR